MATFEGNYDYVTIGEIIRIYGWSRSYTYKRAHLDGWRRFLGRDRLMRYHRADVDRSVPDVNAGDQAGSECGESVVKLRS